MLGIGGATVTAWNIATWPVLLSITSLIGAVLYWKRTPNVKQQFYVISPGACRRLVIRGSPRRPAFSLYPVDHRLVQQNLTARSAGSSRC